MKLENVIVKHYAPNYMLAPTDNRGIIKKIWNLSKSYSGLHLDTVCMPDILEAIKSIFFCFFFFFYTDKKRKKRIQYSLQNYNQLKIVDKIFILERNPLYVLPVIDKYLSLQNCMKILFFFDCMYLLWALTLMHCLRKGSAVHLYQHMVYVFCAFPWQFYAWIVKNRILENGLNHYFAESRSKHLKIVYCFIGINPIFSRVR